MKKYLIVLMSAGFLSAGTVEAATDPSLTSLPEWAAFEGSGDPAFGRSYENHREEVATLKAAYDAWIASPANAAHAAAGFKAAVAPAGKKGAKATAASVAGDVETLAALGKRHRTEIITAAGDADAGDTATKVVAHAATLAALVEHHKPALIAEMAHDDPSTVATANEIVSNDRLLTAVLKRWMKGSDPIANGNKGNGVWHRLWTVTEAARRKNLQIWSTYIIRLVNDTRIFPSGAVDEGSIPV